VDPSGENPQKQLAAGLEDVLERITRFGRWRLAAISWKSH
jgi:hypothetical protein